MSIVAIITARGGSKRIPKKNIRDFLGKPIIAYSIKAAIKSNLFDEVMVSTDSKEIADIAKKYGAKVPFMRSDATSNDVAGTEDVLEEVISEYQNVGKTFDAVCCIYPCAPFLTRDILKNAYNKFTNTNCDSLIPIVQYSYPIQRALIKNSNDSIEYREPENSQKRSQELQYTYHDCGMFYFIKSKALLMYNTLFTPKTTYIEIDDAIVQDIDNESDWKQAEIKYKMLKEGTIHV